MRRDGMLRDRTLNRVNGVAEASASRTRPCGQSFSAKHLAVMAAILAACAAAGSGAAQAGAQGDPRPNVVVVMTDDQTVEQLRVMSQVRSLIADQGVTFTNNFVNNPLCCPSRATFLTGQYTHNNHVRGGRFSFADLDSSNTLPVWLQSVGYRTAHIGKYLNGYGAVDRQSVPPGWSEWYAALTGSDQMVYDYDLNENGSIVHYGTSPADFKGDVLTAKATEFIQRNAPEATPFFLSLAYTAPHKMGPGLLPEEAALTTSCGGNAAMPAQRHLGAFADEPLPRPPSFDEADLSDKPSRIRRLRNLSDPLVEGLTRYYRCALEALQHVDEGVSALVDALRQTGELDSTLIIFTTDNGKFFGEHRIPSGKIGPYEEAIGVPLLMRGPGIPAGLEVDALATNADLASTVLDATGAEAGLRQDGLSLFDLIADPARPRDLLIESHIDEPTFEPYYGVRTRRYVYVEYAGGERELYDLAADPYELESVHSAPAYQAVVEWLARRLEQLRTCRGLSCSVPGGDPPDLGQAGTEESPPAGEVAQLGEPTSVESRKAARGLLQNAAILDADPAQAQTLDSSPVQVTPFAGSSELASPYAAAVSPLTGDVYVTDSDRDRVQQFTATGAFVRKWGGRGSGEGEFLAPRDIAVGPDGDVYVTDTANDRVQQFAPDGTFVRSWGEAGTAGGQFESPEGIAMSPGGDVYVTDSGNDRVQQFTAEGGFLRTWGTTGGGDGQFRSPGGVAVAESGDVYVADRGNDRVQEFAADGTFARAWGAFGSGDGEFSFPRDLAVAPNGDVLVADTANNRVQRFDASGTFVGAWGARGSESGEFFAPRGIDVAANGDVYVADSLNNRVQHFDDSGAFVGRWGAGSGPGQFRGPASLAVGPQGDAYVADTKNDRVQQLDSAGAFVRTWGSTGSLAGEFDWPAGVAVSPSGDVYVADTDNNRVQRFRSDGTFVRKWGRRGSGESEFSSPRGIAVAPNGDVYVADTDNHRVQQFSPNGSFIRQWGSRGEGAGEFSYPGALSVAPNGDVYVADSGNHRIQQFTADGEASVPLMVSSRGLQGIAIGPSGDVWVADTGNHRVQHFTATGQTVDTVADPLIESPVGVAATGRVGEALVTSGSAVLRIVGTRLPVVPRLTATQPASPSPHNVPLVKGSAEPAATVALYTTEDCSGPSAAQGTGEELAGPGIAVPVPADQRTSITAIAWDEAGNASGCSAAITYVEDSTPPETRIDSGPAAGSTIASASASFEFSSPDSDVRRHRCRLDASAWHNCASPKAYTGLADGAHTFRVRAIDHAGNADPTPAKRSFTVDTAAPAS